MRPFINCRLTNEDGKELTLAEIAENSVALEAYAAEMDKVVCLKDEVTLKALEKVESNKIALAGFGRDEVGGFFTNGLTQFGIKLDLYQDDPTIDLNWTQAFRRQPINKIPFPFHNFGFDYKVVEIREGSDVPFQTAWGETFNISTKNWGTGAMIHDFWIRDNLITNVESVLNEAPKEFVRNLAERAYTVIFNESNYGSAITANCGGDAAAIVTALNNAAAAMYRTQVTVDSENADARKKAPFWAAQPGGTILVYAAWEIAWIIQEALDALQDNGKQKVKPSHWNFKVIGTGYKASTYDKAILVPLKSSHTFIDYQSMKRKSQDEAMKLAKKWIWHTSNDFHVFGIAAGDSCYPGRVVSGILASS